MSKTGIDTKKAETFLKRIERLHADLDSMQGKYMAECKTVRQDIKEIYSEAKAAGIPKNALRGLVEYRRLEAKQQALSDGLDLDESAALEKMIEDLGDFGELPLGAAAIAKAKEKTPARADAH
jgi:uncharacterized protein (UPF0335 family)